MMRKMIYAMLLMLITFAPITITYAAGCSNWIQTSVDSPRCHSRLCPTVANPTHPGKNGQKIYYRKTCVDNNGRVYYEYKTDIR